MNEKLTELQNAFDQSIKNLTEAFEGLKAEIIRVEKPKLKTVARKGLTGERVLITRGECAGDIYKIANHQSVEELWGIDVEGIPVDDEEWAFVEGEYEVITEPEQAPFIEESPDELTPNEQRAELIERERKFVEEYRKDLPGEYDVRDHGNDICRNKRYEVDFVVKGNKTTALLFQLEIDRVTRIAGKRPRLVGRSICLDGDVQNDVIGQSIALRKVLGLDIPRDLMYAVQPTEFVKGQYVKTFDRNGCLHVQGELIGVESQRTLNFSRKDYLKYLGETYERTGLGISVEATIINDTNAIYGTSQ